MKSCTKLLVWVFIGIISLFYSPQNVLAYKTIDDDFSLQNFDLWNYFFNGGNVEYSNGSMVLSAPYGNKFPYVKLNEKTDLGNEYSINIKFKFSGGLTYGNGILFSNTSPDNDSDISLDATNTIFQIWPKSNSFYGIWSPLCPSTVNNCNENIKSNFLPDNAISKIGEWHVLNISFNNGVYKINIDSQDIFESKPTSLRITDVWFGNYEKLKTNNLWANIYIDYLSVQDKTGFPIVIIPGLGASWDVGAILTGNEGGDWQIPSFVNNYDSLINSFKNVGYTDTGLNKNLYVFSYDWRKPISELSNRLNDYINTNFSGIKINIVGHSMGGLIARAYAQTYGTANVNKIVTIGSPNMGSTEAYGVWEGAMLLDGPWWSKVALELTTHFGKNSEETDVQTIHRLVPSIKDLLPTYNFLVWNDDTLSPLAIPANSFLNGLNQNIDGISAKTTAIYSNDAETKSLIKVYSPSDSDGNWADGKPISGNPFIMAMGDGTVIETSAKGPFSNTLKGTGWHGELVTKADNIQKIFSVLGLNQSVVEEGVDDIRDRVFVAALKSPGSLEVCNMVINKCNSDLGYYDQTNKIFISPGYDGENLVVKIKENGTGNYKLHLGDINEKAVWTEIGGILKTDGQLDVYNVSSNDQILIANLVDEVPPSTPTIIGFKNPDLACGSITNSKYITVDWSDSTDNYDLAGYEYYVDYPLPNGPGRGIWNPANLWTKSENYGSLNEGVHYIKVRAKDKSGNVSDWSNICEITYDSIKPTLISKTDFSGWYRTAQASNFVYQDPHLTSDYVDPSCVISTEGKNQTCTITPNICDTAGNCNSEPQTSNEANIDMTPPKAPRIMADDWGHRIWVSWWPDRSVEKYRVYMGTKKNELSEVADTINPYWISKILTKGKYYVAVSSLDRAGNESVKSNVVMVNIQKHWWMWHR